MKIFALLFALFSTPSFAAGNVSVKSEQLGFRCVSKMATTSFLLEQQGNEMVLYTLHHNGVEFMPIHEGIIVPNDLGYLTRKSKILTRLGAGNEFRFPLKRCKTYGPGLISCAGGERKNIDGLDVEALNLVTEVNTRQVFDMKYDYIRVVLSLNVFGYPPVSEISMMYGTDECKFGM